MTISLSEFSQQENNGKLSITYDIFHNRIQYPHTSKDIHKWLFSIKTYLIYDNVCSYDTFTYLCYSVVSYISNLTDT